MLLDNIFPDTSAAIRPARPANHDNSRTTKSLVAVGASRTSCMSCAKIGNEKQNYKNMPINPLLVDWTPDRYEGRPCCYLPHVPERLREVLPSDLRGMAVHAEGLPLCLRPFSIGGWRLELDGDDVRMVKMHAQARMEQGCRDFLRANYELVLAALRQCEDTKEVVHE